jgi:hypothetical protein
MHEHYIDANGRPFEEGSRVHVCDYPGTVTRITDPDGDVDDEGRTIGINPKVTVLFDDGSDDTYSTSYTGTGPDQDAPWQCDDLEVIL